MNKIKIENVFEDFSNDKEMSRFGNYSPKSKHYDNSNKLVYGKMKDKTAGVAIEEFSGLKQKMYLYLINDDSEHKKAKGVNRNVVTTISYNEHKDVLLNNKCLRHSMNEIQSNDHRMGTYEINKISLPCFDDKIFIQKMDMMD